MPKPDNFAFYHNCRSVYTQVGLFSEYLGDPPSHTGSLQTGSQRSLMDIISSEVDHGTPRESQRIFAGVDDDKLLLHSQPAADKFRDTYTLRI